MSDPETVSAAAALASRLLDVPGAQTVKRALMPAASELQPCGPPEAAQAADTELMKARELWPVSYTHLTLPTTPYV